MPLQAELAVCRLHRLQVAAAGVRKAQDLVRLVHGGGAGALHVGGIDVFVRHRVSRPRRKNAGSAPIGPAVLRAPRRTARAGDWETIGRSRRFPFREASSIFSAAAPRDSRRVAPTPPTKRTTRPSSSRSDGAREGIGIARPPRTRRTEFTTVVHEEIHVVYVVREGTGDTAPAFTIKQIAASRQTASSVNTLRTRHPRGRPIRRRLRSRRRRVFRGR